MNKATELMINPEGMQGVMAFAEMMAKSGDMIPKNWQGNPGACAGLLLQAIRWEMDPYNVAQQAFNVSGTIGYSAQLVNAVVTSSNAIVGGFEYEYSEGWENLAGKVAIEKVSKGGKNGSYQVDQPVAKWSAQDESGLWVRVGATKTGDDKVTWGHKLFLSSVLIRNSPLWVTDPQQQITYLGVKRWARLNSPAVIMGVYTRDEAKEISDSEEKEINPIITREKPKPSAIEPTPDFGEGSFEPATDLPETQILDLLSKAQTMEHLDQIVQDISALDEQGKSACRLAYKTAKARITQA